MQYGGPGISHLGRDGLVNSEDHFVFFTVGAKPAGFKSTIFLGFSPTFLYIHFSHVCIYSHDGEICTFLNMDHHLQHAASCLSSVCSPCPVEHHLGTRGQSTPVAMVSGKSLLHWGLQLPFVRDDL